MYTSLEYNERYPLASSINRLKHLFGRYESSASDYYNDFVEADKTFDNRDVEMMSRITHNMLKNVNYDNVKEIRRKNYDYVSKELDSINKLNIDNDAPRDFMYPLLLSNGESIKKKLISNKIYVPTLWPGLEKFDLNEFERDILNNMVLIPIDQRYNEEDMKYICNLIEEEI